MYALKLVCGKLKSKKLRVLGVNGISQRREEILLQHEVPPTYTQEGRAVESKEIN